LYAQGVSQGDFVPYLGKKQGGNNFLAIAPFLVDIGEEPVLERLFRFPPPKIPCFFLFIDYFRWFCALLSSSPPVGAVRQFMLNPTQKVPQTGLFGKPETPSQSILAQ